MSGIKKVAIATLSAGVLGGTSTGIYYAVDQSSYIGRKLKSEGFQLLTDYDNNDSDWNIVLNKYKLAKENVFENSKNETLEGLKKKCNIAISNRSSDTRNYSIARQWCVKEETITTILIRGKYKVLNSNDSKDIDTEDWKGRIELVLSLKNKYQELKGKLADTSKSEKEKIKEIRDYCSNLTEKNKPTTFENFGERFETAREICAIRNNAK